MRLTVSLFSALSRALDHIPNAFALAQDIELEKKRVAFLHYMIRSLQIIFHTLHDSASFFVSVVTHV